MPNYNLGFISDIDVYNHVKESVENYRFQINLNDFKENILDPIKFTFDSKVYNKTIEQVIQSEILRQMDKTNSNTLGFFHQYMFRYINPDWTVPELGYDIVNETEQFYVEMKTKHNTMNSSSSKSTYNMMLNTLVDNPAAKCFLVEVIATRSQNVPWVVSFNGVRNRRENIRRISIDKFYELVTGVPDAFKQFCEKLPEIISDVLEDVELDAHQNTVIEELNAISPDLLKSIYLLSFNSYEGFDTFEI